MAQLVIGDLDESKIWLNVIDVDGMLRVVDQHGRELGGCVNFCIDVDGMLRVVDQHGRELGGCVNFCIDVDVESLTRITLTTNAASRDSEGKIQYKLRG